jgi:hypothetical protein
MGVDQTQAAHDLFSERVIAEFGDYQPFFIADNDVFHASGAVDEDADLATEVAGEFYEAYSQFVGAKFSNWYPPAVKTFQRLDLA